MFYQIVPHEMLDFDKNQLQQKEFSKIKISICGYSKKKSLFLACNDMFQKGVMICSE